MKPPKRLFPLCSPLYVNIIPSTLIPLICPPDLIDVKRKKRLKNNPRKNNQWDLLLEPAAMYHQFTPQAESAQPDNVFPPQRAMENETESAQLRSPKLGVFTQPLSRRPNEKAQTG